MDIATLLVSTALKVKVAPALLLAICTTESDLINKDNHNDGGSASYGVCQIKLGTARFVGKKLKIKKFINYTAKDLRNPKSNIEAAAYYLKYQLDRYEGDWCKATAAYNAGTYFENSKDPGKPNNMGYVNKVIKNIGQEKEILELFDCRHSNKTASLAFR